MNKAKSAERGFTLVEIIASIVLLGLIFTVFLSIFPQMLNWSNAAEKELVGSNLSAKVAHEISEDSELEVWVSKLKAIDECSVKDYISVAELAPDPANYEARNYTINETVYTVEEKACKQKVEEGLVRIYFKITNSKNKQQLESYAFVQGGSQ